MDSKNRTRKVPTKTSRITAQILRQTGGSHHKGSVGDSREKR